MTTWIKKFSPPLSSGKTGPLSGKTFSVKDVFAIKGEPVTCGYNPPIITVSGATASIIETILNAGAVCAGATNLDPLCSDLRGENPFFGNVANPVYPKLPCLGSSAGAAASVADGSVDFALGTDSGGSIRAPAASTDLIGFKANSRFFPRDNVVLQHETIDSIGIIARDFDVIHSILSLFPEKTCIPDAPATIAVPGKDVLYWSDHLTRERYNRCIGKLSSVYEVKELLTEEIFMQAMRLRQPPLMEAIRKLLGGNKPATQALAAIAAGKSGAESSTNITQFKNTIFVTPTLPSSTLAFDNNVPLNFFLCFSNILDIPAVSVPVGKDRSPFSMQFAFCGYDHFSALAKSRELYGLLAV